MSAMAVTFSGPVPVGAEVQAVKNGFIHFHSPAFACEKPSSMHRRSRSLPALVHTSAMFRAAACLVDAEQSPAPPKVMSLKGSDMSPPAFEIRTPSTTCSSPFSAARCSPLCDMPRTPRSAVVNKIAAPKEATPRAAVRLPFASLQLPTWAMEKAAAAPPVTDFGDLESWYSETPRSSPASSPAPSPPASPRADHAPVCWADLAEDMFDDEEEDDNQAVLCDATPTVSPATAQRDPGSPVQWADLEDEEDNVSTCDAPPPPALGVRRVQWADLDEECDACDDASTATPPTSRRPCRVQWADLVEE